MGDHDYVPTVVESMGGRTVFHRLAIKPGKPVFAAELPGNRFVLGLPGNPVSSLVTARVVALPVLARLGDVPGHEVASDGTFMLGPKVLNPLPLEQFLLVNRKDTGSCELASNSGSGDIAALSRSAGIARVPAGSCGSGPYLCYFWRR